MEFEVPRRHILRPILSSYTVQRVLRWERQKRCSNSNRQGPMAEKRCCNQFSKEFLSGEGKIKTREDKRMVKLTSFFQGVYLKISIHILFGAWSSLLVHIQFASSEGPKGFVKCFIRNRTMKVGPSSRAMGNGHPL